MPMSTTRHFVCAAMAFMLAGCATSQQVAKPPTHLEGRYVRIVLHEGGSYPVEKVDRLYERVAALLGVTLRNGDSRPTIVVTTPEEIRKVYLANGGDEHLNGTTVLAGYAGGRVLTWGYDASRLARMLAYHVAFQHLQVNRREADRLAARIEDQITWEAMNPFGAF